MQKDESQIEPRFAAASAARCLFYYPLPCFFFLPFLLSFPLALHIFLPREWKPGLPSVYTDGST